MSAPSDVPEPELANSEPPAYYHKMDRRLIILETRFDVILPTIATKSDLIELRSQLDARISKLEVDMHKSFTTMTHWMVGVAVSLLIGFAGVIAAVLTKI
ncbi:hypothetical protein Q4S45_17620 [Massilia sp. R2A-15]|uniref:hypothetical protein n=1 Tax=Massilia sp. R2A-15 TaxID=3064278 RepID=UPI00273663F8|nr:hypothetical protein [Massilia sp. R2A-15]WLI88529.1 hypothetical protein Q4S45_17620 [Massilia sp. R2A-15]